MTDRVPPPPRGWPPDPSEFPALPDDGALPTVLPRNGTQKELVRLLAERFPRYGAPDVQPVQFAETYAHLMAVAAARAEWLGRLLQDSLEREGLDALVGDKMELTREGVPVPVSEELRALVKLEADERTRAERMARDGIRIGIEAAQVDSFRSYGKTVVTAMRCFAEELGLPWTDPAISRISRRAILRARQALGFDVRSPEEVGPGLSADERARIMRSLVA